ncbi:MAG: hypothetical protein GY847_14270 [Proteobacteria bacterium]|nr:hypothetical protein [Pseudomonadota bacterium]
MPDNAIIAAAVGFPATLFAAVGKIWTDSTRFKRIEKAVDSRVHKEPCDIRHEHIKERLDSIDGNVEKIFNSIDGIRRNEHGD